MMSASPGGRFAKAYLAAVNDKDLDALRGLFTRDVVFCGPNQQLATGVDAVVDLAKAYMHERAPEVRLVSLVESGDACAFEIEAKHPGEDELHLVAIDHATMDSDGKVTRFAIYLK